MKESDDLSINLLISLQLGDILGGLDLLLLGSLLLDGLLGGFFLVLLDLGVLEEGVDVLGGGLTDVLEDSIVGALELLNGLLLLVLQTVNKGLNGSWGRWIGERRRKNCEIVEQMQAENSQRSFPSGTALRTNERGRFYHTGIHPPQGR